MYTAAIFLPHSPFIRLGIFTEARLRPNLFAYLLAKICEGSVAQCMESAIDSYNSLFIIIKYVFIKGLYQQQYFSQGSVALSNTEMVRKESTWICSTCAACHPVPSREICSDCETGSATKAASRPAAALPLWVFLGSRSISFTQVGCKRVFYLTEERGREKRREKNWEEERVTVWMDLMWQRKSRGGARLK